MNVSSKSLLWAMGVAALMVQGCTCRPATTTRSYGEIRIIYDENGVQVSGADGVYDFGTVPMGKTVTQLVTVSNAGSGALSVDAFEKVSGDPVVLGTAVVEANPVFTMPYEALTVGTGETVTFEVSFTPPQNAAMKQVSHESVIVLRGSNTDPNLPSSANITLKGQGISGQCDVPRVIDFGAVARGDIYSQPITLANAQPVETTAFVCGKTSDPRDCAKPDSAQGDTAFTFTADSPRDLFTIASGKSKTVTINFSPTESRDYTATMTVRAAEGCPDVRVRLLGTGVDQVLSWTCNPSLMGNPATCDYGYVQPGQTVDATVTFSNQALRPVSLTAMVPLENNNPTTLYRVTALAGDGSPVVSPGGSSVVVPAATRDAVSNMIVPGTATATVQFKPSLLGRRQGALRSNTDLRTQTAISVTLIGFGGGADIDVKPNPLNFGKVAYFAGAVPPSYGTRRLTVSNVGTRPPMPDARANLKLGVGGVPATTGLKYWKIVATNAQTTVDEICIGALFDANGLCLNDLPATGQGSYNPLVGIEASGASALLDIPVRVTPATTDPKAWELTIYSNDPDEPEVVIPITAQPVSYPPCTLQVTPVNLNFGVVTPPNTKDLSFTLKNMAPATSTDKCLITNLDLRAGSDAVFTLPAGVVNEQELDPQQTMTVLVRASPTGQLPPTPTTVTGQVQFNVSNPTTPQQQVALSATLAPSCLVVSPSSLDFGTVQVNCNSGDRTFQAYNSCSSPITIQSVNMVAAAGVPAGAPNCAGPNPCPEFVAVSTSGLTGTLTQGGMPQTFQLKYRPLDLGADTGAFVIRVLQAGQPVDYVVTLKGAGDSVGQNVDTFRQDAKPKADILLVVDDSCSMSDKQMALGQNFASFIRYATSSQVDFQIGLVTTDFSPTYNGYFRSGPVTGFSQAPKINKVITPNTPNLTTEFASFVNVGTGGSGSEGCMEPATKALTAPLITDPTANGGFLRSDAVLAVVCVTDADEQSPQAPAFYLNQLQNIKGAQRPGAFSYNVIGPFLQSPPGNCSYDGSGDDGKHAFMVTSTNGVKEEICTPDWARALENIGKNAFGFRTNFFLTARPDLTAMTPAILVTIDGVNLPAQDGNGANVWSYDSVSNSVNFEPLYVPEPGKTMTVTYRVACIP